MERLEYVGNQQSVLHAFTRVHEKYFESLRKFHDREWHGGYLCFAEEKTGVPFFTRFFGFMEPERARLSWDFCLEKASRLARHPEHLSSFQSRDEGADKYGGAIRLARLGLIASFSGLPEKVDEVSLLATSVCTNVLELAIAEKIVRFSENRFLGQAIHLAETRFY